MSSPLQGSRVGVRGLGTRFREVFDRGYCAEELPAWFWVWSLRVGMWGLGFGVRDFGLWILGLGFWVWDFGVWGFGVLGFGF